MPPVPVNHSHGVPVEQTTMQKLKMGAMMGGTVGLCIGFIFGSFSILRNGAGPQGALSQLTTTMIGSGATFGLFMGVGTVIRTQSGNIEPAEMEAYRRSLHQNTAEALRLRLRWNLTQEQQRLRHS